MSPGLLTRSGENRLPSANLTHFWRGLKVWLVIGVALWQAAWEVPDLVPGNKLVQKRGKEENNLLHIEPAKSQLGNISQAGNHLPGMSSPGPPLTFLLNWSQKPTPRHLGRVQGVERSALLLLCDPPGGENAPVQTSHILSGLVRVWEHRSSDPPLGAPNPFTGPREGSSGRVLGLGPRLQLCSWCFFPHDHAESSA